MNGWYVLYVRIGYEKSIHTHLLQNKIESFLPVITEIRQWKDRRKKMESPLFPSYIFVRLRSANELGISLSIRGVLYCLKCGKKYSKVKEEEIKKIKLLIGDKTLIDIKTSANNIKLGEERLIEYGPLSGLKCNIERINSKKCIVVRIHSLGQNIVATIPSSQISYFSRKIKENHQ